MADTKSQSVNTASKASASLAATASTYASNLAKDASTKSTGLFYLSTFNMTLLAIAIGGVYYLGYLDNIMAYIMQSLGLAHGQSEQAAKRNTGATLTGGVAKGKMIETMDGTEELPHKTFGETPKPVTGGVQPEGPVSLLSNEAH